MSVLQYFIEKAGIGKDFTCDGKTLLVNVAAKEGHFACVKYLLKVGDKYYDEHLQATPLHCAAGRGHLDIVKYLMDHHRNICIHS